MDDPAGRSIAEFINHPSFRSIATFFLGFVFISCIHYTYHVPVALARHIRSRFLGRRGRTHGGIGLEANRAYREEKVNGWLGHHHGDYSSSLSSAPESNNLALSLTICFAMWSVAEFGSLLVFSSKGQAGCAFLVAWGGMAVQAARLLGLLKLSLDLKKMGVPRWETLIFWGWLVFALVMMFVSNAISIGTIQPITTMPDSTLCFRKHFLATAVVSSIVDVIMEAYCLIRFHYLLVPAFLSAEHKLDAALDVRTSRALSLLILEIASATPAAKFFSVLTDILPASIGALLVLAAFNQRSPQIYLATTASIPATRPESIQSSTIEIKKMPSTNSLANHYPRVSHPFSATALQDESPQTEDWPESTLPDDLPLKSFVSYPESTAPPSSRRESTVPPSSRRHTWRTSGQSMVSESDSDIARSVKGAVVAFASKEQVGQRSPRNRAERRSFLPPIPTMPSMSEGTKEPNPAFPRSTPLRIPKPTIPPAIRLADLERASSEAAPSVDSRPQISITTATPVKDSASSKPKSAETHVSLPISVPSNYSDESQSLHLTPVTPGARSQPSHRTSSSSESAWRYDARHDSLGTDPERGDSEESSRRQSGMGLPPADDDLSIVYEASHEDSDSLPPSRRAHRPTFGEHMFVQGGLGRPVNPPADVPQDVHPEGEGEGGSSGSAKSASMSSGNRI